LTPVDPDQLEVAPGFAHEDLQGRIWQVASAEDLRAGLEKAFDYRGDVTITRKDGSQIEGYLFDRQKAFIRIMTPEDGNKLVVPYDDIAGLAFTGRDTAAGKSWAAWVSTSRKKQRAKRTSSSRPKSWTDHREIRIVAVRSSPGPALIRNRWVALS
jgi:hypothetical protein